MDHGTVNRKMPLAPSEGVIDVTSDGDEVRIRLHVRRPTTAQCITALTLAIALAVVAIVMIVESKLLRDTAPIVNVRSIITAGAAGLIGLLSFILLIGLTPLLEPETTFLVSNDELLVRWSNKDHYRIPRCEIIAVRIVHGPPQLSFDLSQPVSRVIQRLAHPKIQFVTPHGIVQPLIFDSPHAGSAAHQVSDVLKVPIQEMDLAQAKAVDATVPSIGTLRFSADDKRALMALCTVLFGLFTVLISWIAIVDLGACWWTHVEGKILFIVGERTGEGQETFYRYAYNVEGRWHLNNDKWPPMDDVVEDIEAFRPQDRLGSKVDVYYNPSDPTESTLRPYKQLWQLVVAVPVAGAMLVLLYALWRVEPAPDRRELAKRYVCEQKKPDNAMEKQRKPSQPPSSIWRMLALLLASIFTFHLICEWALPAAWRMGWFPECRTEAEFREIAMLQLRKGTACALIFTLGIGSIGLLELRLKAKRKKMPKRSWDADN